MRVKTFTVLGLLLCTLLLRSQTDYRQGYVMLSAVDTVYGDIDYRGYIEMGRVCGLRTTDNVITEYTPYDIYGYRFINSKYYISKEIYGKRMILDFSSYIGI